MQTFGFFGALLPGAFAMSGANLPVTVHADAMASSSFSFLHASSREAIAQSTSLPDAGAAQDEPSTGQPSPAKREEAVVNPVSAHADCVRPRGAAVEPPPQSDVPCSKDVPGAEKRGCPGKQEE